MWDQNSKHGFGVFTFQDGEQYIGRFHNDKMIEYNSYGFSIPNTSKPQNEKISRPNSKQAKKQISLVNSNPINKMQNESKKDINDFEKKESGSTIDKQPNDPSENNSNIKGIEY